MPVIEPEVYVKIERCKYDGEQTKPFLHGGFGRLDSVSGHVLQIVRCGRPGLDSAGASVLGCGMMTMCIEV